MLMPIALFCLNAALGCGSVSDAQASFERDSVPVVPPSSASSDGASSESSGSGVPSEPSGALELNPLPVAFGKFGGNVEIALAPHQVLVLSPAYFDFGNYFHGPEAELGYRFYFYRRALSGPYVGAGVMGAAFQYHPEPSCGAGTGSCSAEDQSTYLYGATLETGWQWRLRNELVLGVGLGLVVQHAAQRRRELYQSDLTNIAELVLDSGVHPRGMFTVGYAF